MRVGTVVFDGGESFTVVASVRRWSLRYGRRVGGLRHQLVQGRMTRGVAHHEGAVAAWFVSKSSEGRRFDDRWWTRGKYMQRGESWGAFGRPTLREEVEAEGEGLRSVAPCQSRENNRERGQLGAATRQEEERGPV
jgi:hypothetical protein